MAFIGLAIALRTRVNAGLVGLAVTQIMMLTEVMSNLVMQWTEMETSLGAVTRISSFIRETPREEHANKVPYEMDEWPTDGAITLENISATYE